MKSFGKDYLPQTKLEHSEDYLYASFDVQVQKPRKKATEHKVICNPTVVDPLLRVAEVYRIRYLLLRDHLFTGKCNVDAFEGMAFTVTTAEPQTMYGEFLAHTYTKVEEGIPQDMTVELITV